MEQGAHLYWDAGPMPSLTPAGTTQIGDSSVAYDLKILIGLPKR